MKNTSDESDDEKKEMQDYVNILFHDLRSHVNNVIGFSELLLEETYSPEATKDFLAIINKAGNEMSNMVNNYLLLSKLEHNQANLEKMPISVLNFFNEIKKNFADLKASKRFFVLFKKHENSFLDISLFNKEIAINNSLFSALLRNLLRNATEACTEDDQIDVNIYEENNILCVSIFNKGEVPEKIREKLFQKFATSKEKGTGLGLYSAKTIAEAHGGELVYEPLPGGTRFIVSIPFV
ncbi:MAG: HAMP domain-containing sensor histidine kinase [Patescibacteria group bacterium]